jgi:hypothetical protein
VIYIEIYNKIAVSLALKIGLMGSAEIDFLQLKALVDSDSLSEIGLLKGLR